MKPRSGTTKKKNDMDPRNMMTAHEAMAAGRCDSCVCFYPGKVIPPFTTHCHNCSTMKIRQSDEGTYDVLCSRKG
jgi:hypothetical protein